MITNPHRFSVFLVQVSFLLCTSNGSSQVLEVGSGYPYGTFEEATQVAVPGDTILVHEGFYPGGVFVGGLQGTATDWIHILAAPGESVVFLGGSNAWQFTDAAYLEIKGFVFQQQTGNGLNFDDGGSYETPAHHIHFDQCTFRDMDASGNNDLLKLSGLDSFEIRHCLFFNGSAGGSGIDMVGCHDGLITQCHFENLGSNSIQAKGGTRNIRIERNYFKNGGSRTLNLGGSTGLQFFRPLEAPYEAAELKVYSNIFIGSDAPIAFVGSVNCEVVNNTIYLPTKWVLRILQETVDTSRFPPCGYNTFRNNIIYIDNRVNVACNIGPNTAPETFTFSNNLWYHSENNNWPGPDLPVTDENNLVGEDPDFANTNVEDFSLWGGSPAIGIGYSVIDPQTDYNGDSFLLPRSVGAFEGGEHTGIEGIEYKYGIVLSVFPNPAKDRLFIQFAGPVENCLASLTTITGVEVMRKKFSVSASDLICELPIHPIHMGAFILTLESGELKESQIILLD